MHHYTAEQAEFIKVNVKGRLVQELTGMFNKQFGTRLTYGQIRAFTKNHGLKSGIATTFKPGNVPFNKGKPRTWSGGESTQFHKGQKPHNYAPLGSERVNGDGYVDIKVSEPNRWRAKHLLVWEQHHERIVPEGYVVIFADRNRRNFDPDNLLLVSRAQLATMNKNNLIQSDAELTKSGVILADIYHKISERKRRK